MSWQDNLRQASFRGVRFHVEDRGLATGRRIHNHEYPKRDSNFPEDMGKKSRTFSVSAYIVGDDYMSRRDALLAAAEREGPGQYVDHWGRSQRVVCEDCTVKETRTEGRICRIELKFIEAGGSASPVSFAATAAVLAGSAAAAAAAAVASFAQRFAR